MAIRVGCLFLILFMTAARSAAQAPTVQVYQPVEKGFEIALSGGFCHDFKPPAPNAAPGFCLGLEAGYDLSWVFRLRAGMQSWYLSASGELARGGTVKLDWDAQLWWAGAQLALLATPRFYLGVQAGVGYLRASPKEIGSFQVAGSDDVALQAGGYLEYYLGLRHFSVGVEAGVDILPRRGDVALLIMPVVRYTFGGGGVKVIEPPKDRDQDGVPDQYDACPENWGPESNRGCPEQDSDSDGVPDREDNCPQQPGPASNSGCPLEPDTDGDGVKDSQDACPKEPGQAASRGCPDGDSDGVPDHVDKCPKQAGKVEYDGCPSRAHIKVQVREEKLELREKIHFEFGKAVIKRESYPLLDQVAATLKDHPEIRKLRVEGHTDNKGSAQYNLRLSQKRAEAVVEYLVKKGVERERLVPKGFGLTRPIASNATEAGRAANRRVEMIILERD